ncbi:bacterial regulatory s, tetR family protein [Mycobacterium xenopi 4042]|uniref:Bacterial regulatory s, tetR family protein n=1 Tax=Mycobacterium xenopi 4042 TaxID=1299334 RepID=X8E672_MYCXE|nr:bacterial regulatory s, tetR family protein [Mycobacterium xenopi 3993]EUA75305.1 bacterial regulatory s, tetR family protein [Mycobacterium xenopi 4042]
MAKQATADKRQRRERGSINPDDIITGAFELAEQVSIDNLSMPLLGKHLGVGVTSIYWYFRKKDDLLNAMTDRALRRYVFATPYVEASDWRETLRNHARSMRKTFIGNPILCDLILIRSALSPKAARLGFRRSKRQSLAWSRRACRPTKRSTPTPRCRCMCGDRWCCIGCTKRIRRLRTVRHAPSRTPWSSTRKQRRCLLK